MRLTKLEAVSLSSANVTEKMVQEQIAEDPSILGLGKLELRDKERIQAHAGRLDLLLQDPDTLKRYEVELQLGTTDETHIIRTSSIGTSSVSDIRSTSTRPSLWRRTLPRDF